MTPNAWKDCPVCHGELLVFGVCWCCDKHFKAVAEAVAEERERCAGIVEGCINSLPGETTNEYITRQEGQRIIATAIRQPKGGKP